MVGYRTPRRRARREQDKRERRRALLGAALRLFTRRSFGALTMAEVARRAGLAKGTVYLYYRTKEELFMAVVEDLLAAWFDEIDAGLQAVGPGASPAGVARLLARSVVRHEQLARLLAILHTSLEHNVAPDAARRFKQLVLARLQQSGARLEACLGFLGRGQGARLLVWIDALVIGLRHLADPAPVVRQVLDEPGMEVFRVDFGRELAASLAALFRGVEAGAGGRGRGRSGRRGAEEKG